MNRVNRRGAFLALSFLLSVPSFLIAGGHDDARRGSDTVYTISNAAAANQVLIFVRNGNALTPSGSFATGGRGTGGGLGSQGSVVLTPDEDFLLAVNAGSNDVSVFEVRDMSLRLVGTTPTGGTRPISIAVDRDLVYVLNAGSADVTGFQLSERGRLSPLAGSRRELSAPGADPAQVSFSPDGGTLVVTEKATNNVVAFALDRDGLAETRNVYASPGQTPFGFAFGKNRHLFVSEAAGGAPGASSVTSWRANRQGELTVVDPAVATLQGSACWVVVTPNGRFVYTTNTSSDTITGFRVRSGGKLQRLDADGVTANTSGGPTDFALNAGGRVLYVLNAPANAIDVFVVHENGALDPLTAAGGLPASANGLAVR
jgi:6-phosphogluconolactonase